MTRRLFTFLFIWAAFVATAPAPAQTYRVLLSFTGGADGGGPYDGIAFDRAGNLYGTAEEGGTYDVGTVFKVDQHGKETVLYNFGDVAYWPCTGLVRDAAGNLCGATGATKYSNFGIVYKLDATNKETTLHSFGRARGIYPCTNLVRDAAGNLYGGTLRGGNSNLGVLFRLNKTGKETVLYTFTGGADGGTPTSVTRDKSGNLYGTTALGGGNGCEGQGCGVVFQLDPIGKQSVLHSFTGTNRDGAFPNGPLVRDVKGNLYGTTYQGGRNLCGNGFGCGTLFKLDKTGKETVLYNFAGQADGANPDAGIVRDDAGNLYGTTVSGGTYAHGTVFKLDRTGQFTVLHSFKGEPDGDSALGLVRDAAGKLYGATGGGAYGHGMIFELIP